MNSKKLSDVKKDIVPKLHVKNVLKLLIKLQQKPHKDTVTKLRSFRIRSKNTLAPILCRITHRSALCERVFPPEI